MTGALTTAQTALHGAVWAALGTVLDPELDEPLTDLGFVQRCQVYANGHTVVRLRLPTYFCAPNWSSVTPKYGLTAFLRGRDDDNKTAPRA